MITIVEDQFGRTFRIQLLRVVVRIGRDFPDMLAALRQRFVQRIGISSGRSLQGNSKHGTRFQIHRMLGFVGQDAFVHLSSS